MKATRHFCIALFRPWAIVLLCMLYMPGLVSGREPAMENPNRVQAAYLRNFAHYVTWPENAFSDSSSPWHIGILGQDPFGDVLESTLQGRTEQGRSFVVHRADNLDELPPCQMIFVAYKDVAKRRTALGELKNRPVLTIGDAPDFLREGGVIQFHVGDRVRMSINLDQARGVALSIQTRMLEVSSDVLDNGVIRKVK